MTALDHSARNALDPAWAAVHDARPEHWYVGRPMELHPGEWVQFAYDPRTSRRGTVHHAREWTATASTELAVVEEMARCLRVIAGGGWPE